MTERKIIVGFTALAFTSAIGWLAARPPEPPPRVGSPGAAAEAGVPSSQVESGVGAERASAGKPPRGPRKGRSQMPPLPVVPPEMNPDDGEVEARTGRASVERPGSEFLPATAPPSFVLPPGALLDSLEFTEDGPVAHIRRRESETPGSRQHLPNLLPAGRHDDAEPPFVEMNDGVVVMRPAGAGEQPEANARFVR